MSLLRSLDWNTIRLPAGDHAPATFSHPSNVRRDIVPLPSSRSQISSPVLGLVTETATLFPSGESLGGKLPTVAIDSSALPWCVNQVNWFLDRNVAFQNARMPFAEAEKLAGFTVSAAADSPIGKASPIN